MQLIFFFLFISSVLTGITIKFPRNTRDRVVSFNGKKDCLLIFCLITASSLICHSFLLGFTLWIDVCPSNGNLVASVGQDKKAKIFDKRESRVVQTFDGIHTGNIFKLFNKTIFHL